MYQNQETYRGWGTKTETTRGRQHGTIRSSLQILILRAFFTFTGMGQVALGSSSMFVRRTVGTTFTTLPAMILPTLVVVDTQARPPSQYKGTAMGISIQTGSVTHTKAKSR